MGRRSQEERQVAIALRDEGVSSDLALEGIFIAGRGDEPAGVVLAPPHPEFGGSLESPVLAEVAWGCKRAGVASLRFNWRGVGASAGARSGDPSAAQADYASALAHLEETVPGILVAGGYSFGAAAAVRAAKGRPRVRRLLLVAPPPALLDASALAAFPGEVLMIAGGRDALASPQALAELASGMKRCRFVSVEQADHFFSVGLPEIGKATADWLGPRD